MANFCGNGQYEATEAERSLIGAALLDPAMARAIEIEAAHFADPWLARLWGIIADLLAGGLDPDPVTLRARLTDEERDGRGSVAELMALWNAVPSAANAHGYAALVREAARSRGLARWLTAQQYAAHDRGVPSVDAFLAELQAGLGEFLEGRDLQDVALREPMLEVFREALDPASAPPLLATGYPTLDEATGGLQPGTMWVISASQKTGKSTLAMNVALAAAAQQANVGYLSLEMNARALGTLALAKLARVRRLALSLRRSTTEELDRMRITLMEVAPEGKEGVADRVFLLDQGVFDAARVGPLMARQAARRATRLVFLDHLQLVNYLVEKGENRPDAISRWVAAWRAVAQSQGLTLVLLSQITNEAKRSDADSSQRAQAKGAGGIVEAADVVCRLVWPRLEDPTDERYQPTELLFTIDRQRAGPSDVRVRLRFYPEDGRIEPWIDDADNPAYEEHSWRTPGAGADEHDDQPY